MLPIERNHSINAIHNIDAEPELRKGRESLEYDLFYNGKTYPPILVLSEANKLAGGTQLVLSDFGNSTKTAFKILNELKFTIRKRYPILTKEIILKIIELCNKMAEGKSSG